MKKDYIFHIDSLRYKNAPQSRYVLIKGWAFRNDGKPFDLAVVIDGKAMPATAEIIDRPDVSKQLKGKTNGEGIGFSLYVPLSVPEITTLALQANCAGQSDDLLDRKKSQLDKIMDTLPFDYQLEIYLQDVNKGRTNAVGWLLSLDGTALSLSVVDSQGHEPKTDKQFVVRKDLVEAGIVDEDHQTCGFNLSFDSEPHTQYYLRVSGPEGHTDLPMAHPKRSRISLVRSYLGAMSQENVRKAMDYLKENGVRQFMTRLKYGPNPNAVNYDEWRLSKLPNEQTLKAQRETQFEYTPKISIIVAAFNTPVPYLKDMIDTVRDQSYTNWQLCIADGSTDDTVQNYVRDHYGSEEKIVLKRLAENYGIAGNMNEAMKMADGDFIALYDHDDTLTPDALFEFVKAYNEDPSLEVFYSDEDKMNSDATKYFQPNFKPDFNIDLLCSNNYICHFFMVKKSIIDQVGMFRKEYDGAQDYDFILRCCEAAGPEHIHHVPKVLYHWRTHEQSTSSNPESKMYAFDAGTRAVQAHYDRMHIKAVASKSDWLGWYRTKYILQSHPLISIIIPNKDHTDDLDRCIQSIEKKSAYKNYEYIIVENNSTDPATFDYYHQLEASNPKAHVVYWQAAFNYSALNNFGAAHAKGDYFLLLNNDTELINSDCLEEMLGYCMREDVGAVGARLLYPDDTVQHAGVIIGIGGIAGHTFIGLEKDDPGYFNYAMSARDYSAVTAACMLVKRSVYEEVGGFNEQLAVAFNDVDFCLKIREAGYLIVYDPYAQLYHYESKSRGMEDTPEKVQRFNNEIKTIENRWHDILEKGDPCYNPNLTLERSDFSLKK